MISFIQPPPLGSPQQWPRLSRSCHCCRFAGRPPPAARPLPVKARPAPTPAPSAELCQNKPYNSKTDVWSLGCVLYEMLTFKRPFDGPNIPALMVNICKGKYSPIGGNYSSHVRAAPRGESGRSPAPLTCEGGGGQGWAVGGRERGLRGVVREVLDWPYTAGGGGVLPLDPPPAPRPK